MKLSKPMKFLIFIVFSFLLGFLSAPLFHSGYLGTYFRSLSVRWYFHLLFIVGVFYLTLSLHELTHFITFNLLGYKNEVLIITFFIFYKQNNKWKVKIDFKLLLLGGGMVVPDLGVINNEEDFNKAKEAVRKSLLAAPLFTLISGILIFLIVAIFFYGNKFLVPFSLYTLIFSLFYTYLSTREKEPIYGDFKAYKRVENNLSFAQLIVLQYTSELTPYLKDILIKHLEKEKTVSHNLTSLSFFNALLDYYIFESQELSLLLYEKLNFYMKHKNRFKFLCKEHSNIGLCQSIIFYLDRLNFRDEALIFRNMLFESINDSKMSSTGITYITKQTNHLLNLIDESEYINNPKNIDKGFLSFIYKNIPSFIEVELFKNKGYTSLELTCEL